MSGKSSLETAGIIDSTEQNFIIAVWNTKKAGVETTRLVHHLEDNLLQLEIRGKGADAKIAEAVKKSITVEVNPKLEELKIFASSVIERRKTNNKEATGCHRAARAINESITKLEDSLRNLKDSLDDDPFGKLSLFYRQVLNDCRELRNNVVSLPSFSQSYQAIRQKDQEKFNEGVGESDEKRTDTSRVRQTTSGITDSSEDHFIDLVNNTRNIGRDVVSDVKLLESYASSVRDEISAPKENIRMLQSAINQTVLKLRSLSDSVDYILKRPENEHKEVVKCQDISQKIQEAASDLALYISEFKEFVGENSPRNSPTLSKEVSKRISELDNLLDSFPVCIKNDYTIGTILENYQDCENITNDLKEFQANEDIRRKEEMERVEQQMKTNMEQLAELRKLESERQAAEEARHEKSLEAIADRTRKNFETNLDREDRRLQENHKKQEESIENLIKTLEKQKEFLSTEIKSKTKSQLETMQRLELKLKDETERAASKVVALNGERLKQLDKLRESLKKYNEEHKKTLNRYEEEVEENLDEQNRLLVAREINELLALERLTIQDQDFKRHMANVVTAGRSDQTDRDFIYAVSNTKTAGTKAISALHELGYYACRLKVGQTANETAVKALRRAIAENVLIKLDMLKYYANSVLKQQKCNHEKTTNCHEAARKIDEAIINLVDSLGQLKRSLEGIIIGESFDIYKHVMMDYSVLEKAVTSMPAVSQSKPLNEGNELDTTINRGNILSSAPESNLSGFCNEIIGVGKSRFKSRKFVNKDGLEEIALRHYMDVNANVFKFQIRTALTRLGDDKSNLADNYFSKINLGPSELKTAWHKENMLIICRRLVELLAFVGQKFEQPVLDKLIIIDHLPHVAFYVLSVLNSTEHLILSGLKRLEIFPDDSYAFQTVTWIFELWFSLKYKGAESTVIRSNFQQRIKRTKDNFDQLNLSF